MINTPVRMALIDHYYKYLMFLYNRINVMYQGVGVFKVNTYILYEISISIFSTKRGK